MLFWNAMIEIAKPDVAYMRAAIEQAQAAGARGEVPVGAVIVSDDRIVGRGGNRTILDCDPSAHAEIVAMREAARTIGNYRLLGTTLYATIEPCAMCAGAMVQARIARLVYGAEDPKGGAVHSCFSIFDHPQVNHRVKIVRGLLADDAATLLQNFFAARR
jgi:tRNA(adenine34) deaminase